MSNSQIATMSPQEYLEHLQREHFGHQVPAFEADVGDILTANLLASLSSSQRALLDRVAIGVLPTSYVNAWVAAVPSGGKVIGFNFGTMSFLLELNKILVSRTTALGFEPCVSFDEASHRAFQVIENAFGQKVPMRLRVNPRRMLVAACLSNVQTSFVVGHELGHVLLGHLRDFVHGSSSKCAHDQEYAADERAMELVATAFARSHDPIFGSGDMAIAQAGVDLFFTYLDYMDRLQINSHGRPCDATHPRPVDRRQRLRDRFWAELPEPARELALAGEAVFQAIAEDNIHTSAAGEPKRD